MKVYKTQAEVEKDIKDGILAINGDVRFECSISISASIKVSGNINALHINAYNINAVDINARDINASNIDAVDIDARDINAVDINASNILYYAFCNVYDSINCLSIESRREVASEPICLEGELTIRAEKETIQIGNNTYDKSEVEQALKGVKSL